MRKNTILFLKEVKISDYKIKITIIDNAMICQVKTEKGVCENTYIHNYNSAKEGVYKNTTKYYKYLCFRGIN